MSSFAFFLKSSLNISRCEYNILVNISEWSGWVEVPMTLRILLCFPLSVRCIATTRMWFSNSFPTKRIRNLFEQKNKLQLKLQLTHFCKLISWIIAWRNLHFFIKPLISKTVVYRLKISFANNMRPYKWFILLFCVGFFCKSCIPRSI